MSEESKVKKVRSVRLSQYLKDTILASVLTEFEANNLAPHGFKSTKEVEDAADQHRRGKMMTLWDTYYGEIDFSSVPDWALVRGNSFSVAQEDDTSKVFVIKLVAAGGRQLPCKGSIDALLTKERWEAIFKKSDELLGVKEACEAGRLELRKEVKPILDSFGSTRQLLDTWPSLEKFLPANVADPDKGVNLPALSLSRLEEKINGRK